MSRTVAGVRLLVRAFSWLAAGILAIVVVWYAANRLLDPPLHAAARALDAAQDRIPDDRNAAVGVLGLTAPSGADFMAYGAKVKALYVANAPHDQIVKLLQGPRTLQPTVESGQVTCWLDPDWPLALEGCLPFGKAAEVLEANRELLARLRRTYALGAYARTDAYFNQAYLTLIKLSIADMQLDLRQGAHETAYRKWREQFGFVRASVGSTDNWLGRAVGLVAMGMTLPVLENLVHADPGIAKRHAAELYELVRPDGIAAFSPEGIVRGEYALLAHILSHLKEEKKSSPDHRLHWLVERLGQKNRILNRYAGFAPEYVRAMLLPYKNLQGEYDRLREKYHEPEAWDLAIDPIGSVFSAVHIDSQLKIRAMVQQMHYLDGRLRLTTLALRQMNENVRDAEMTRFLADAGPGLGDPFSGQPMQWDPKDRKIYMVDPDERCLVMAWFRLPASRGAPRPSPSPVSTNAC